MLVCEFVTETWKTISQPDFPKTERYALQPEVGFPGEVGAGHRDQAEQRVSLCCMQNAIQDVSQTLQNMFSIETNGIPADFHTTAVTHSSAGTDQLVDQPPQSLVVRGRVRIQRVCLEN